MINTMQNQKERLNAINVLRKFPPPDHSSGGHWGKRAGNFPISSAAGALAKEAQFQNIAK